jgi:HEAT repeat protein
MHSLISRSLLLITTVLTTTTVLTPMKSQAAIPSRSKSNSQSMAPALGIRAIPMSQTLAVLDLPFENRIAALKAQGPGGYKNLRSIMFDPKSKIDSRWRSTTAVGRLGGPLSLPELERAAKADVWELRSAALIAVSRFDRRSASKWSRALLKDKALLVRLTAVETLETIQDRGSVPQLWVELNSKQNFKRSQSLFIRRRIVEALGKLEASGSEDRFVALLEDSDPKLHVPAIAALERLTGRSLGKPTDPLARRRALWQQWQVTRG